MSKEPEWGNCPSNIRIQKSEVYPREENEKNFTGFLFVMKLISSSSGREGSDGLVVTPTGGLSGPGGGCWFWRFVF